MAKKYETEAQRQAYAAGVGYGTAKVNKRVPVKEENKDAFRDGVKAGRGLKPDSGMNYSDIDKLKYYGQRMNDQSLSQRQRDFAARKVVEFSK